MVLRRRRHLQRTSAQGEGNPGPERRGGIHTGAASHKEVHLKGECECQVGSYGEGPPGGGNCMCKGTDVCSGTSEQFVGARAPSGTTVSTEARALSKDHITQGLECRAKEFDLAIRTKLLKLSGGGLCFHTCDMVCQGTCKATM